MNMMMMMMMMISFVDKISPGKMAQAERLSLVLGRCPVRYSADKNDHKCVFVGFSVCPGSISN
jgi:hypothetical protein